MRPPAFWFSDPERPACPARLLAPLGALYARATASRVARPAGFDPELPVICIGNINAGGTGKTPTVIALIERLAARGVAAGVVSRGHGGRLAGPILVDPAQHSAAEVGDEPLLLSAFAPVWVARDRAAGARRAAASGVRVILLDDGFQNPAVAKDLSIVVVDAAVGFGNGRVIPAGPLREPVEAGLARADLVLAIGAAAERAGFAQHWGGRIATPLLGAELAPLATGMDWRGLDALAFAGIGRPEKFFRTLEGLGVRILRHEALDDHQPLGETLMRRLEAEARALGARLVTTEKDAARLPPRLRGEVLTLPVRLVFDDAAPLDAALDRLGL